MRVCMLCVELFGVGFSGGFGRSARAIAAGLVERGLEVSFILPRRSDDRPDEFDLDGMRVHQFSPAQPWRAIALCRRVKADLFHSHDPSQLTWLASWAAPRTPQLVAFQDPLEASDLDIELRHARGDWWGWVKYRGFIDTPWVRAAARRAAGLYCAAECLVPKATRKYALPRKPGLLPTPVLVPAAVQKAARPTVCFVGRWHPRKRPELFLEMARRFPDVHFVCVGAAEDPVRDRLLRDRYRSARNLTMTGTIDQFESDRLSGILGSSWILINTAEREGLPNVFLEAAAHRCAVLSCVDPDSFASRFGVLAPIEDFDQALRGLLESGRWRELGARGHAYVGATFGEETALDAQVVAYERVLAGLPEDSRLPVLKGRDTR